ncbi:MAG: transglycosylase SLT domain-containing protein [Candidatus Nomurabacteria bacterium]|jgi:hypothetical protein|nr:transglycosylase SLT domain-containing protein [Candidatus Nomurabacteria bacterium]
MKATTIGLGVAAVLVGFLAVRGELATVGLKKVERRVVVVYDGVEKRVLKTDAATVGEVLTRAGIGLEIGDKITPEVEAAVDSDLYFVNIARATPMAILEWADARTAKLYGKGGQPFAAQLYDVVAGEEVEDNGAANAGVATMPNGVATKPKANLSALKIEWMTAAGIAESDWEYVDYIVFRESSWNPNAVNRQSGACGLVQALPCSKVPGNPFDPVDSLKWQKNYVERRYGGYRQAYEFWVKKHWY